MSSRDALRWNARYRDPAARNADRPPALLLEEMASLPSQGLALDVAMGLGAGARRRKARGRRGVGGGTARPHPNFGARYRAPAVAVRS